MALMAQGQKERTPTSTKLQALHEYNELRAKGVPVKRAASLVGHSPQSLAAWQAQYQEGTNTIRYNYTNAATIVAKNQERIETIIDDALWLLGESLERARAALSEKRTIYAKDGTPLGEEFVTDAKDAAFIASRVKEVFMDLTQGRRGQTPINVTINQQRIDAEVANILSAATPEQLAALALAPPTVEGAVVNPDD